MVNKIKTFFSTYYLKITGVVVLAFMALLYLLKLKDQKIDNYKVQISGLTTQTDSDALEAKIKADQSQIDANSSKMTQYNSLLDQLNQKRQQLTTSNLTPQQVEQYWNKPNG
jgi:predicted  nucleic acid-binding Zn-ribbon protein